MERAERRRSPRVPLNEPAACTVPLRARVKLLELSLSGALVTSDLPLPPGARGQLRFSVAGSPCVGTVTVRRCATGSAGTAELGAMFTSMDEPTRRQLETFLRTPST